MTNTITALHEAPKLDHEVAGAAVRSGAPARCAGGEPVVCPGKIALFRDQTIVAVADIPKVCISSLMHDRDPAYQTVAVLSSDRRQVFIAGAKDNVPLAGDFSGVKDCTVAVPIPR